MPFYKLFRGCLTGYILSILEPLCVEENVNIKANCDKEPVHSNTVASGNSTKETSQNKNRVESRNQPDENEQGILSYEDSKSSKVKELSYNSSNQYLASNKRMTVPAQKKPKRSFEEALFGGGPPILPNKRHATSREKTNIETVAKNQIKKVTEI